MVAMAITSRYFLCRFMSLLFVIFISFYPNIVNQSQIASTARRIAGGIPSYACPAGILATAGSENRQY